MVVAKKIDLENKTSTTRPLFEGGTHPSTDPAQTGLITSGWFVSRRRSWLNFP